MSDRTSDNAEVRDDFIEALLRLFREGAAGEVSVATLCAKAGYSRSTFYRYFDSLDEVHEALEDRSIPQKELDSLIAGNRIIGMEEITNVFLSALIERKELYATLFARDASGRFLEKLKAAMKPVFKAQAERAFDMTPFEYEVIAEYLTTAKLSLLRMWALSPIDLDLSYMTKITDSTIENGLWDRVDESNHCQKAGRAYRRSTIDELAATLSLAERIRQAAAMGVIEADLESFVDSEKIKAAGLDAVQLETRGVCHVEMGMVEKAWEAFEGRAFDYLFLENIGNLVCPADFDTGAHCRVMLLSVPEGYDKVYKYPPMFAGVDALIVTKTDYLPM